MIDAHQHFWRLSRGDYDWLTPDLDVLYRDFEPADLEPLMHAAGVRRTVLVQAAPTREETDFLLGLARQHSWIAGVVGWVDLEGADAPAEIAALATEAELVGVRPMIQDIADPDWMLRREVEPALRALAEQGLAFDALVKPVHLPRLATLLARHPELRVVIDHAGKPRIGDGEIETWARDMSALSLRTNTCCKLSGLVTEAAPDWTNADLRPYVDHVLDRFGAERVMWGSDWPVVEMAGGYARWRETSMSLLRDLSEDERGAVLGGTAARFYRLPVPGPES